jgi:hypothetical protein
MKPRYYLVFAFLAAILIAWYSSSAQPGRRSGPVQAGRPGEFHFILAEQAEQNRLQFREVRAALERLRAELATSQLDGERRTRAQQDVDRLNLFVLSMEMQLTLPAGSTAGQVEARLNSSKGESMCGACHAQTSAALFSGPVASHRREVW